jgi:hypothetical protein
LNLWNQAEKPEKRSLEAQEKIPGFVLPDASMASSLE